MGGNFFMLFPGKATQSASLMGGVGEGFRLHLGALDPGPVRDLLRHEAAVALGFGPGAARLVFVAS